MKQKTIGKSFLPVLMALISTLAVIARLELYLGGDDNLLFSLFNRLYNTFNVNYLADIIIFAAFIVVFKKFLENETKFEIGTALFSVALAFLYELAIFYDKYNASDYMFISVYQCFMTVLTVLGFTQLIYVLLRAIIVILDKKQQNGVASKDNFFKRHIFSISFIAIFTVWLTWNLVNYPGSMNPDSELQLEMYLGRTNWSNWHPVLSTLLMGICYSIGSSIKDANLGLFIYCLLQTITGSLVFALTIKKMKDYGASQGFTLGTLIFFAFEPMWGAYAQWFEKDFLYTQAICLQLIVMADIFLKRNCEGKDFWKLLLSSLLAVFLRNNGIYAIIPALICMGLYFKKKSRRNVFITLALTVTLFETATRALYPAIGIESTSVSETLSPLIQQTARYTVEYESELTDEERAILTENFGSIDNLKKYDARESDTVKIHYNHHDFKGYISIWFKGLIKHPGVYFEATLNGAYGYLAPVATDTGAWPQRDLSDLQQELGVYHTYSGALVKLYIWLWNLSMQLPILRVLTCPGLYTWVILILGYICIKRKKSSLLILLVPSLISILVCIASPLANAMRYALPIVACSPLLITITVNSQSDK